MSLTSLTHFWDNKTIKLSDSFVILIKFKEEDDYKELYTCCGFTVPKIEYEEETLTYGNMEQIFLTPKYDSCKELTLEFFETWDYDGWDIKSTYTGIDAVTNKTTWKNEKVYKIKPSCTLDKIFQYINLTINQKYNGNTKETNFGLYDNSVNDKVINNITIKILDNKLKKYIYKYSFDNLKVVNYSIYNLEFQSDSPCKVTVNLSFEGYYKQAINEIVDWPSKNVSENNDDVIDENDKKNEKPNNMSESVDPPKESSKEGFEEEKQPSFDEIAEAAIADVQSKKDALQQKYDKNTEKYHGEKNSKDASKFGKTQDQKDAYDLTMSDVNEKLSQFAAGELSYEEMQEYRKELEETQRETTDITKKGLKDALKQLDAGIAEVQDLNEEEKIWVDASHEEALQELEELELDEDVEDPPQAANDLTLNENPEQQEDEKQEPASELNVDGSPQEPTNNEELPAETPTDKESTPDQNTGKTNETGDEQSSGVENTDLKQQEENAAKLEGESQEAQSKPQPDPNYHKDELGNEKYESEEGTLYKTEDGKKYYEDKQTGKIYDVDNGFVESNAHEGLVSETKNGDTQYYTSVIDNGEEVYRDKNVTTEVNTSERARHAQDNAGQSRTPPNLGANESGSQNNTTVSQTSEGGGQSAHDAAEESRKKKEAEMKAEEEAKKTKAMEEARRGQTRGSTPPARGVGGGGSSGPSHAEESEGFYNNGANR